MTVISHFFKLGDKNDSVKLLQRTLRECVDFQLKIDGDFGEKTRIALLQYQNEMRLEITGLYTDQTKIVTDQYISKRFVQEHNYAEVAEQLGRDVREFTAIAKAIAKVEARAEGFISNGNVSILFERHKFYSELVKRLKEHPSEIADVERVFSTKLTGKTAQQVVDFVMSKRPDICNTKAGGYVGGMGEHARLNNASDINPMAATNSASYGLYQIMGFNAKYAGFKDGNDMFLGLINSEISHLLAFGKFLESNKQIYTYLRAKNYPAMAKLYNGPGYAANNYDGKLKSALSPFGY